MEILTQLFSQVTLNTVYFIFSVLVATDVICGMLKAWKLGRFKSRTLRDGLFASMGELIVLMLCIFITKFVPVSEFIVFCILIFMSAKELYSIIENLIEVGVKFPTWMVKGLQVFIDRNNNLEFSKGDNKDGI